MRIFGRCWHEWSIWNKYYHEHTIWDTNNQNAIIERQNTLRQYRACLKCGFAEDLIVAKGTGGPQGETTKRKKRGA